MMQTTHEEHKKGGYFQKGCDECAKFVGQAVMSGHLQKEVNITFNGREVTLIAFECKTCGGAIGIDASYLDQVDNEIKCPYCEEKIKVE